LDTEPFSTNSSFFRVLLVFLGITKAGATDYPVNTVNRSRAISKRLRTVAT
jgi:hypothetical protein